MMYQQLDIVMSQRMCYSNSLGLQIYTEEFVCSVVLGNDIIPRLSLIAMEKLKYSLLEVIKTSKLPKVSDIIKATSVPK